MLVRAWPSILVVFVLQIAGLAIFATGFFPKKIVQDGVGEWFEDKHPEAEFDKLVLMVVDAMRADFTYSTQSEMKFIQKMVQTGYGIPFTAHSTPPTVTMPRIKGITTGGTPNFLDAILNISEGDKSSSMTDQDSWLKQFKMMGKKIHMFGDDTWIKLFPDFFDKIDGTASFFVSDFTEVDNNVTRHVEPEMNNQEWDLLILHYLGLDHIGHKGGPYSPFMPLKQKEMDSVAEQIYNKIDDKTLFIVMGDHGMNEVGNHGGSSGGETSPSMTFLSPRFKNKMDLKYTAPLPVSDDYSYYRKIQQGDLVSTIAMLFGFPIPKNSLGVFIQEFLPIWNKKDQITILKENIKHMETILDSSHESSVVRLGDLDNLDTPDGQDAAFEFLKNSQEQLSKASGNYKVKEMSFGVITLLIGALISHVSLWWLPDSSLSIKIVLAVITLIYTITTFGSSWVEEEHYVWYFCATGWIAWSYIISARKRFKSGVTWIICLAVVRILRGWNSTGNKYANGPDVAKYLQLDENASLLWFFIALYYGQLAEKLWRGCFADINAMAGLIFSFLTVASSFVFKMNMAVHASEAVPGILKSFAVTIPDDNNPEQLISLARLSFATIGIGLLYMASRLLPGKDIRDKQPVTHFSYLLEVFLVNQTRTRNIPIFLFFSLLRYYVRNNAKDVASTTIFILILQQVSFFALGNSNSLATVDLANAYNGVGSYNMSIVGILTFVSNWVGPLYWSMTGTAVLLESRGLQNFKRENVLTTRVIITQFFYTTSLAAIMTTCLAHKHHLFIWTVFSPKLLYAAAWVVAQHGLIDVVLTCILAVL